SVSSIHKLQLRHREDSDLRRRSLISVSELAKSFSVMAEKCKDVSEKNFEEVMMGQVKEATQEFLRGKPFTEYQTSPFFEKQVTSDKYFYEFRTLGKGGFGEVSVCTSYLVTNKFTEEIIMFSIILLVTFRGDSLEIHTGEMGRDCFCAGTKGYMAPEILKQEPYHTSVDWWALGCSIYEMVAGRLPFRDHKEKFIKEEIVRRTLEDECKFEHKNFDALSKDINSLFLKKNIEDRLGCKDEPRMHEFFKSINIPRLEAGLIAPPWLPKPNVKGVEFDASDENFFFNKFSTGAVPISWQQEMIDSRLFDELNNPNRKKAGPEDDDEQKSKSCTLL
uniref:G protein-coupled receptor kinase 7b n=1 Tax=Cyprinus carpio TaxID=7962 RepID=A0A8C1TV05_CYPCA